MFISRWISGCLSSVCWRTFRILTKWSAMLVFTTFLKLSISFPGFERSSFSSFANRMCVMSHFICASLQRASVRIAQEDLRSIVSSYWSIRYSGCMLISRICFFSCLTSSILSRFDRHFSFSLFVGLLVNAGDISTKVGLLTVFSVSSRFIGILIVRFDRYESILPIEKVVAFFILTSDIINFHTTR